MEYSLNFKPPVIAHRGASSFAPENTMSAFVKAAQLGLQWIEFDVMQASDGEPIIFHDELLDRTTNQKGEIIQYPYAYLQTLDAGSWFNSRFAGEPIPNLQQMIAYLENTKLSANLEIKALPDQEERLTTRVLYDLQPYLLKAYAPILFSSFSIKALYILRQYSSDCLIGLLMDEWLDSWEEYCEELQCVSIHVNHEVMTMERAQRIKKLGKKLLCYTVNNPIRALELYSFGVDAVFTDVPQQILNALPLDSFR